MSNDLHELISDVQKLVVKYARSKSRDINRIRASLQDSVEDYKDAINERATAASEHLDEWSSSAMSYARANPWVPIAVGVGVAATVLLMLSLRESDQDDA